MRLRIEGHDLPGRSCAPAPGFPGYDDVHVAVQRRRRSAELLDPQPGDAESVGWTLEVTVVESGAAGGAPAWDLTGPYVQGPPGGRFVYLCWGTVTADGGFAMFRRAKLMVADIDSEVLGAAARSGRLTGRLGLTDAKGQPVCARVRPPAIHWTAG